MSASSGGEDSNFKAHVLKDDIVLYKKKQCLFAGKVLKVAEDSSKVTISNTVCKTIVNVEVEQWYRPTRIKSNVLGLTFPENNILYGLMFSNHVFILIQVSQKLVSDNTSPDGFTVDRNGLHADFLLKSLGTNITTDFFSNDLFVHWTVFKDFVRKIDPFAFYITDEPHTYSIKPLLVDVSLIDTSSNLRQNAFEKFSFLVYTTNAVTPDLYESGTSRSQNPLPQTEAYFCIFWCGTEWFHETGNEEFEGCMLIDGLTTFTKIKFNITNIEHSSYYKDIPKRVFSDAESFWMYKKEKFQGLFQTMMQESTILLDQLKVWKKEVS